MWAQQAECACLMLGVPHLIAQTGSTPLYIAAQNGHLDIVRLLLDRSANVDAANKVSEGG